MAVNKKYKDSVFRSIFNNKSRLLELYNAIHETNHQDESIIEINTLKNALFSARKNDISFTVNEKMVVLIEHQSTIDGSMPLRILSYIVRVYEKIISRNILRENLGKIARPEFIVLYNGKTPFPEEKFIRLSDLFEELDESEKNKYSDLIFLDVLVVMLNINKGRNPGLERKSKTLRGYATFVAKVREYEKKRPLEKAVKSAVEYCVKKGILADYFKQNTSEEANMNYFLKYDEKVAMKVAREEGMERGMKKVQNYVLELMAQGLSYEEIKKKIEEMPQKNHG
ncbi:MAG: Rpn family recombination-promoting nuclease/putative transposase [Leptospirales bacterium]|nr:Rpn family recombination-promoting nuclease/putative transposase [Leptospirales bacterium]